MAKHATKTKKITSGLAITGLTAFSISPAIAWGVGAPLSCEEFLGDNLLDSGDLVVTTLDNGVCEIVLGNLETGSFSMMGLQIPDGVSKLGAVLVGMGGASQWQGIWNGGGGYQHFAGGGGQVTYVDFDTIPTNFIAQTVYDAILVTDTDLTFETYGFEDFYFAAASPTSFPWVDDENYGASFPESENQAISYATWLDWANGADDILENEDDPVDPFTGSQFLFNSISGSLNKHTYSNTFDYYYAGNGTNGDGDITGNFSGGNSLDGGNGIRMSQISSTFPSAPWSLWSEPGYLEDATLGAGGNFYFGDQTLPILQPGMGESMSMAADGSFIASNGRDIGAGSAMVIIRFQRGDGTTNFFGNDYLYQGPIDVNYPTSASSGGSARITGDRLASITGVTVNGIEVAFKLNLDGSVSFRVPTLPTGTYEVKYHVGSNTTFLGQLKINSKANTKPGKFSANKLFAGFVGDKPLVSHGNSAAINSYLGQFTGVTHVTCVGLTSGVPALPSDLALATSRAKNACDIVRAALPNATVRELTKTGAGTGSSYRGVRIYVRGTN